MPPLTFGTDYVCHWCKGSGEDKRRADGRCGACLGTGYKRAPQEPRFDGDTYEPGRDRARLSGSLLAILEAMRDGGWWTLPQLAEAGACSPAAASARLRDLRKPRFGGYEVEKRYVGGGSWEYHLGDRH